MNEDNLYSGEEGMTQEEKRPDEVWNTPQQERPEGEYYRQNTYWQNSYQQNGYSQYAYQQPEKKPSQAFGIASLVLGILSLVLFCTCCNIPLALVAFILGIVQLVQKGSSKGMAIGGMITSVLSIILMIIFYVMLMLSMDFQDTMDLEPYMYKYYEDLFPDDDGSHDDFEFDFGEDDDTF